MITSIKSKLYLYFGLSMLITSLISIGFFFNRYRVELDKEINDKLIIGAEMFGKANGNFSPRLPLEDMDLTVVHELIHYQQNYIHDQSLLAQSIREGTADFFCELVTGKHLNEAIQVW